MALNINKIEFDLKIKKYGFKPDPYSSYDEKKKPELQETLDFKSLSAVEVIRKLLDYIY